ncbi:unnamed protein product [Euphydryas editha]|uniref:CUB domain-containing protein n=1 Tax=Euphydryas editha TaxID=104508 RepID=A0AAU9TE87_EUPED|nr:unnamed protein product [Euphydryas editha]
MFVSLLSFEINWIDTYWGIQKLNLCTQGDYVKIYWEVQGPGPPGAINERSAWSRVLCGNRAEVPPALYSPGPSLILEFYTDSRHSNNTGFLGTYSFVDRRNNGLNRTWREHLIAGITSQSIIRLITYPI